MIGVIVIACVILVFFCRHSRKNHRLFALSVVIITVAIAFSFVTGKLHGRYIAVLSPLLVCVTVVMLNHFSRGGWRILIICAVFFGIYLSHIEKTMDKVNLTLHDYTFSYSLVKEYVHLIDVFKNKDDYVVLDISIIPRGAYGYFDVGKDDYSGTRFFQKKAPKRTISHFRYTVSKERLEEVKSHLQHAKNKNSVISFTRKSYKPVMEEVLGPIDVLKSVGKFMVWRGEIVSAKL